MEDRLNKLRKRLTHFDDVVELILGLFVAAAIIIEIIKFVPVFVDYGMGRGEITEFMELLNAILVLVIGSEFFKMMLKPSMQNITEVLIFLISRHMIMEERTPVEDLISVISITILFLVQHFLIRNQKRDQTMNHVVEHLKERFADAGTKYEKRIIDGAAHTSEAEDTVSKSPDREQKAERE